MIGLVDCKTCNLQSLMNALEYKKIDYRLIKSSGDFSPEYKILLPGVGSFNNMMKNLKDLKILDNLKKYIFENNHFLGICVGMQVLFEKGHEDNTTGGLNIFKGTVKKINITGFKTPIIGWNSISVNQKFTNLPSLNIFENSMKEKFYFLHSYFCDAEISNVVAYSQISNFKYPAIIKKNNIYGVQFHPEKSREQGLELIKNFSELT